MNEMTVHYFGLAYYSVCSRKQGPKYALVPNGRREDGRIPQHFASIFVERARCEGDDWWPAEKIEHNHPIFNLRGERVTVSVFEFRIPKPNSDSRHLSALEAGRTEVTFPDGQTDDLDVTNLEQGLGHLKGINPRFAPDFDKGNWISRISMRGGTLSAFRLNSGPSVVQWRMRQRGPLIITATKGTERARTIRVRPQVGSKLGAEVVFMNSPDFLSRIDATKGPLHVRARVPHGPGNQHIHTRNEAHHLELYNQINEGEHRSLDVPTHLQDLEFGHATLKFAGDQRYDGSCSGFCC